MTHAPLYEIRLSPAPAGAMERARMLVSPRFGIHAPDRMVTSGWTERGGYQARLQSPGPLQVLPSASAVSHAPPVFEGAKAYQPVKGSVRAFRPGKNAAVITPIGTLKAPRFRTLPAARPAGDVARALRRRPSGFRRGCSGDARFWTGKLHG